MTDYLVFRLYGPMASWGDIAVGEVRPSYTHPSKSAVLGLVAAALRINRDQEDLQQALADAYGFAVRVDSMGVPLVDYHTVQAPRSGTGRNRLSFDTRREELSTKDSLSTILSRRDYRMDALATVALWACTEKPPYTLTEIMAALGYPGFVLYLGRKSCPPALPLEAQVISGASIREALGSAKFQELDELCPLKLSAPALYWDEGGKAGIESHHVFERRDVPLSRRRWQFDVRREHHARFEPEN